MTQKTHAQAIAERIIPVIDRNPARSAEDKRADLMCMEFARQIRDGEQFVVDAQEYERLREWQASQDDDAGDGEE